MDENIEEIDQRIIEYIRKLDEEVNKIDEIVYPDFITNKPNIVGKEKYATDLTINADLSEKFGFNTISGGYCNTVSAYGVADQSPSILDGFDVTRELKPHNITFYSDVDVLENLLNQIIMKKDLHDRRNTYLSKNDEFSIAGYSYDSWIHDIKIRINQINDSNERTKLISKINKFRGLLSNKTVKIMKFNEMTME